MTLLNLNGGCFSKIYLDWRSVCSPDCECGTGLTSAIKVDAIYMYMLLAPVVHRVDNGIHQAQVVQRGEDGERGREFEEGNACYKSCFFCIFAYCFTVIGLSELTLQ